MAFPDRCTVNVLLTILLFAAVISIIYVARSIIAIFIFAILFAYLIDPVVRFLQRHSLFFKNLRGPHVLEAYLAFLILIAIFAHAVTPGLLKQTGKVVRETPSWVDGLLTGEVATEIGGKYGWSEARELRLKSFLTQHRTDTQSLIKTAERLTWTAMGGSS
jgi:predicted PurR-regulated permease PerM